MLVGKWSVHVGNRRPILDNPTPFPSQVTFRSGWDNRNGTSLGNGLAYPHGYTGVKSVSDQCQVPDLHEPMSQCVCERKMQDNSSESAGPHYP